MFGTDIKTMNQKRFKSKLPVNNGQNLSNIAMGPRLAYWPNDSSMNMSGRPANSIMHIKGMRKAPGKDLQS